MMAPADYNTPTKDDLNFKGSFIKKSEERRNSRVDERRASRADDREIENRQEQPVT
jgi:hypothetical protein